MNQYDGILKMYAESGLRTTQDCITLGRDIQSGVKPRLDASHRGELVPLYSRDQTQRRLPSRPKRD